MRVVWKNVKYPRIDLRSGDIVVIAPPGTDIDALLESKREWIEKKLAMIESFKNRAKEEIDREGVRILDMPRKIVHNCKKVGVEENAIFVCKKRSAYLKNELKKILREDIEKRIEHYSLIIGAFPKKIYIREQSTKWGSCSSSKNLSFNLSLIFLPELFRDYVVAHELVHLIHPDHGEKFKRVLENLSVKIPTNEENLYCWYYAQIAKERLSI